MSQIKKVVEELGYAVETVTTHHSVISRPDAYAAVLYLELVMYGHVRPETAHAAEWAKHEGNFDLDWVMALLYAAHNEHGYYATVEYLDMVKGYVLCG